MKYEIIDNFLDYLVFSKIKKAIHNNSSFPWYCIDGVSKKGIDDGIYFIHMFYDTSFQHSNYIDLINPIISKINPKAIIRIKGNLYSKTETLQKHGWHEDFDFEHKGCIFYLNTNDGKTILEDGTEIDSVENRMLFFEPHIKHRSTNCTDENSRVNINFNYF